MMFGKVNQGSPLYLHNDSNRNQLIKGVNTSILKSQAKLCAKCNNARSAPYDRAWQVMSEHIYSRLRQGQKFHRLDLKHVFPPQKRAKGVSSRGMAARVQLYFVKLWGTRLAEARPDHVLLPKFAESFLTGIARTDVYFAIKLDEDISAPAAAACTEIHSLETRSDVQFMTWGYGLGRLFFQLYYSPERWRVRARAWNPADASRFLFVQQSYG